MVKNYLIRRMVFIKQWLTFWSCRDSNNNFHTKMKWYSVIKYYMGKRKRVTSPLSFAAVLFEIKGKNLHGYPHKRDRKYRLCSKPYLEILICTSYVNK